MRLTETKAVHLGNFMAGLSLPKLSNNIETKIWNYVTDVHPVKSAVLLAYFS